MDTGGLHTLTTPHRQSLGFQYDRARVDMRKEYQPVLFALNKKKKSEKDVINLGMSRLGFVFFHFSIALSPFPRLVWKEI